MSARWDKARLDELPNGMSRIECMVRFVIAEPALDTTIIGNGWVGASLLATLAEVAGSDCSPQLYEAWTEAYGAITGLMKAGRRGRS